MRDSDYISDNGYEIRQAAEYLTNTLNREVKPSHVLDAKEVLNTNVRDNIYDYIRDKPSKEATMTELIEKVKQWGYDRNIIQEAPTVKQAEKTLEECGELLVAVATNNKDEVIDAIGDIQVTMILQCAMQGISYVETLKSAYNVIKDRKGKLINGKFVKEAE